MLIDEDVIKESLARTLIETEVSSSVVALSSIAVMSGVISSELMP